MKQKIILIVFTALLFSANISAQSNRTGNWCATDQQTQELYQSNPALLQHREDFRKQVRSYIDNNAYSGNKMGSPYIIPVVVHNITHNGGSGYVSKAEIEAQLLTLNQDFQRLNADTINTRSIFVPYAGALDIQFRLAHKDPNGNCTEGIVRVESPLSNFPVPRNSVKSVSYWDSKKYFNIWVIDNIETTTQGFIAGYAQFPSSGINGTYGVVVVDQSFGGGYRTLTHEVGHCFGLYHTFQSGCGWNCSNSGDDICDTPPATTATYGCNYNQNSCSNDANGPDPYGSNVLDQVENYMSYDACQNMFTLEQGSAMQYFLNLTNTSFGLHQLNTTTNRNATGVNDPYGPVACAPIAQFTYNKEYICEQDSVTFTDQSYNAIPTAWNWTFTGGTPNSSSVANPTITYNTAGVYSVTHRPSTSAGNDVITKTSIITVSSLTADYVGPFVDGFENPTQFGNDWRVENIGGGQTWGNTTNAAATGSRSTIIRNFFTTTDGLVDELISPSYDISTAPNKLMKFKYAFAKKTSADTDKLLVYWSLDCGSSWTLKLPLTTPNLVTAPDQSSVFVPNANEWNERSIDLSSIGNATNVRFKFAFTSGGGNEMYLDDINIAGNPLGVDEFDNIASFSVYPNPTESSAQISFNLIRDVENLSIKVRNALGQEVTNVINGQSFNTGKYTLQLDKERKLSSGLYFVEFNADNNVKVQKLIVQ